MWKKSEYRGRYFSRLSNLWYGRWQLITASHRLRPQACWRKFLAIPLSPLKDRILKFCKMIGWEKSTFPLNGFVCRRSVAIWKRTVHFFSSVCRQETNTIRHDSLSQIFSSVKSLSCLGKCKILTGCAALDSSLLWRRVRHTAQRTEKKSRSVGHSEAVVVDNGGTMLLTHVQIT